MAWVTLLQEDDHQYYTSNHRGSNHSPEAPVPTFAVDVDDVLPDAGSPLGLVDMGVEEGLAEAVAVELVVGIFRIQM